MNEIELPWPETACWPNRIKGAHWSRIGAARRRQRLTARRWAAFEGLAIPAGPVLALVVFHPPTRRRWDLDGAHAALKGAIDGLFEAVGRDDAEIVEVRLRRGEVRRPGGAVWFRFEGDPLDGGDLTRAD